MAVLQALGAPGGTQSLSTAQFGATPLPSPMPTSHGATPHPHDHGQEGNATPLSAMASNFGTVKSAATWRKPSGTVLPYSVATRGSVFNPF